MNKIYEYLTNNLGWGDQRVIDFTKFLSEFAYNAYNESIDTALSELMERLGTISRFSRNKKNRVRDLLAQAIEYQTLRAFFTLVVSSVDPRVSSDNFESRMIPSKVNGVEVGSDKLLMHFEKNAEEALECPEDNPLLILMAELRRLAEAPGVFDVEMENGRDQTTSSKGNDVEIENGPEKSNPREACASRVITAQNFLIHLSAAYGIEPSLISVMARSLIECCDQIRKDGPVNAISHLKRLVQEVAPFGSTVEQRSSDLDTLWRSIQESNVAAFVSTLLKCVSRDVSLADMTEYLESRVMPCVGPNKLQVLLGFDDPANTIYNYPATNSISLFAKAIFYEIVESGFPDATATASYDFRVKEKKVRETESDSNKLKDTESITLAKGLDPETVEQIILMCEAFGQLSAFSSYDTCINRLDVLIGERQESLFFAGSLSETVSRLTPINLIAYFADLQGLAPEVVSTLPLRLAEEIQKDTEAVECTPIYYAAPYGYWATSADILQAVQLVDSLNLNGHNLGAMQSVRAAVESSEQIYNYLGTTCVRALRRLIR